ncbi:glutaminyl-peptide cyclotransferase [Pseudozobellia thermophila]|uniref:Glutamine cyclotransferase n=1 Tax=Pseudozobellia thermophila TaxID=192903 RepID=A0A1M6F6Q5_9FLAO|nr:glutaminyl-peptide cyclotransferase [Pseudozobellia thermophila]SHI93360.1 Glutamine cyclotransferase [Pseudozobellia thermophila]
MNTLKFFSTSLLFLFMACGGDPSPADLFEIDLASNSKKFQQNQSVAVSIKNKKNIDIGEVTYFLEGNPLELRDGKLTLEAPTLGDKTLKAEIKYEDQTVAVTKDIKLLSPKAPEIYTYKILNEYPHDNKAYTQGLEFHNDTLYESTGKKGRSSLRKVDWKTGEPIQQVDLEDNYFGEGITIMNNKIYMLTWRSGIGFIYDLNNLERIDSFRYGKSKEGWGLTNDGKSLFKSDGTEKIWILNPDTLVEEGAIETVTHKSINDSANELEYVDGKIYANVYQKPSVMIIDAKSGAIEGVINFSGLSAKVTHHATWSDTDNVLNGIAYHPGRKTFFVTGKEWDKMFEVIIEKK